VLRESLGEVRVADGIEDEELRRILLGNDTSKDGD
jgi:hypothetical protein